MALKKEAAHDCKKDCDLLHKEVAALKKEVAALKKQLASAPKSSGNDPRIDKIIKALQSSVKINNLLKEQGI